MFRRPTDPTRTQMRDALRQAGSACPGGHCDTDGLAVNTFRRSAWCPTCGMPAHPAPDLTIFENTNNEQGASSNV